MPKHILSESEKDLLKVVKNENDYAQNTPSLEQTKKTIDTRIAESEELLRSIGHGDDLKRIEIESEPQTHDAHIVRSFDDLLKDANERNPEEVAFEDIFSNEELEANRKYIRQLNAEFNTVHDFDTVDVIIPVVAGILSGAIDCFFGGFVKTASGKSVPGTLSDYVGKLFDNALPAEKISELEKLAKVTYDAQDNRNTTIYVDTLSSYFHRFLQLGHDPILGFVFGVADMLRGTMTTIDYNGKFVVQFMENYSDRKASSLFEAIAKVFLHMLSDVNTPASLPVPFMALFNKLQIGSIGEEKLNIAELVKSMYGQGYDFRHFCAMSIPVMIIEVVVRVSYFVKRLAEGHSFSEAISVGLNHEKKPKLGTMLFIAHSASTAINTGKVIFTENPLDINYPQWIAFTRYSVKQLKWVLYNKPALRDKYVMDAINNEWSELSVSIDNLWDEYSNGTVVVCD
ncbi:hypothetical protein [Anoxynatronum buryatiense]|uniref:Uncharacterized protein n=1 Tax=Anoxynatronum buryatiense TaxID=489973 RepID=A0AA46AKM4_9CLOT|nr:hypothetical protein [Anoxynatronum buryatiense]SMP72468.1 hypothetical protein SAMN06296020_1296 [Anoxynatronum buryatiense]